MEIHDILLKKTLKLNKNIKFIKYGLNFIIYLTTENKLYGYGDNCEGQLGLGPNSSYFFDKFIEINLINKINKNCNEKITLVECGSYFTIFVNTLNEIYFSGNFGIYSNLFSKCFVKMEWNFNERIEKVVTGDCFMFIVTKNNSIFGLGNNFYGQLGILDKNIVTNFTKLEILNIEIKSLQCGNNHSILLEKFGNIYGTGQNHFGQLGLNDQLDRKTFTKIELPFKIKSISCSANSTLILNENNQLFGAGYNIYKELGLKREFYCKFMKIIVNNVKNIYKSWGNYNFIVTKDNDSYFSGTVNSELVFEKFTKFTNVKMENIYPILNLENIYLMNGDCINFNNESEMLIGCNCLQKAFRLQLIDVKILFD